MSPLEAKVLLQEGINCQAEIFSSASYKVGDLVRARVINPTTYTRLPRYIRGKTGVINKVHGAYVFPDALGHRLDPDPQYVYSVRFAAQELWGKESSPKDALYIDLFDTHLEPA